MTIRESLDSLKVTKQAIRSAIQNKGVSVPLDTAFRDYANKIAQIESASSSSEDYLTYKNQIKSELDIEKPVLPEKYARLKTILEADTHVGTTKVTMLIHKNMGMIDYFDAIGNRDGLSLSSDDGWYADGNDGMFYNGSNVSFSNSGRIVESSRLETVTYDGEEYFYVTFVSSKMTTAGLCYFIRENRNKCVGMYVDAPKMTLESLSGVSTPLLMGVEYFDVSDNTELTYKVVDNSSDITIFDSFYLLRYGFEFIKRIPYSNNDFYTSCYLFKNCNSLLYVDIGNITWNKTGYLTIMGGETTGSLKKVKGNITCLPLSGDDQPDFGFGGQPGYFTGSYGRYMFEGNIVTYSHVLNMYGPAYIKGNITIDSKVPTEGLGIFGKVEYIEGNINASCLTTPRSNSYVNIFTGYSYLRVVEGDVNVNVFRRHTNIFCDANSDAPIITGGLGITCNNDTSDMKNLNLFQQCGLEVVKDTTINAKGYAIHITPRGCRLFADTFSMVTEDCSFEISSNSRDDRNYSSLVLFQGSINSLVNPNPLVPANYCDECSINAKIFNGSLSIDFSTHSENPIVYINSDYIGGYINLNTNNYASNIFTAPCIVFDCDFSYSAVEGNACNMLPFLGLNSSGVLRRVKVSDISKFAISCQNASSSKNSALIPDGMEYQGTLDLRQLEIANNEYLFIGSRGDSYPGTNVPNTSFKVKIGDKNKKIRITNYNEQTYIALAENAQIVTGEHEIRVRNLIYDKYVNIDNPPEWVTTLINKGWTISNW